MPASGGSMSIPASSIIFGIEPRVAMPIPPQAVQSMASAARRRPRRAEAGRDFAEQVVGGTVVRLSRVAEAAGDGAERHRRAQRHVADGVQQVEPAVRLHVEDQVEFRRALVGQEVAALDAGGMQQHVDAPGAFADLRR